jgi:hypothetical protein
MALSSRQALMAAHTQDTAIIERICMEPHWRVIALDIDKCSAIGSNTYEILRLIKKMTNNFQTQISNLSGTSIGYCKKSNQSYEPTPTRTLYVGQVSNVLGRVPLMPLFLLGNTTPTIPYELRKNQCN